MSAADPISKPAALFRSQLHQLRLCSVEKLGFTDPVDIVIKTHDGVFLKSKASTAICPTRPKPIIGTQSPALAKSSSNSFLGLSRKNNPNSLSDCEDTATDNVTTLTAIALASNVKIPAARAAAKRTNKPAVLRHAQWKAQRNRMSSLEQPRHKIDHQRFECDQDRHRNCNEDDI